MNELLKRMRDGLVVSCQAHEGEPFFGKQAMQHMAVAAAQAGAVGIRADLNELEQVRAAMALPIIGIAKQRRNDTPVIITPTLELAEAVRRAGAEILAFDATGRLRPGGLTLAAFVAALRARHPGWLLMADVATADQAEYARDLGVDLVGTTLGGYVPGTPITDGPDLALLRAIAAQPGAPAIAEGRIHTPEQAAACLAAGAHCVVVGGAITRPQEIAGRFVAGLRAARQR